MPSPPLSIIQSLSPRVAVLASDDVNDSCNANGCKGLEELLRPWEGGTERGEFSYHHLFIQSSELTPSVHPVVDTAADRAPFLSAALRLLPERVPAA